MQILENGKEYAWSIETKAGDKPSFYIRVFKDEDKVIFETKDMGIFTKEEFTSLCLSLGRIGFEEE